MTEDRTPRGALQSWAAKNTVELDLPSGTRVKVRIPSVAAIIRGGSLPGDLRAIAFKFARGFNMADVAEEEFNTLLTFMNHVVAMALVAVQDDAGAWESLALDAESLEQLAIPEDDFETIRDVAIRRVTPRSVNAQAAMLRGDATPDQVAAVAREEADGTVDALADFRGEQGGADAGSPGEVVGSPAERPGADIGSAPGADVR